MGEGLTRRRYGRSHPGSGTGAWAVHPPRWTLGENPSSQTGRDLAPKARTAQNFRNQWLRISGTHTRGSERFLRVASDLKIESAHRPRHRAVCDGLGLEIDHQELYLFSPLSLFIPCFSLLKQSGGLGFGVFDPKRQEKAKQALEDFLKTDRVISMHSPDYRSEADLGSLLRAAVAQRCAAIQVERAEPRRRRL